ncbi:MAG: hypothetical protein M1834_002574 [Cirrosporium novae-zelandiae]|nr:MAG: hypothetical protein M1834_002574 [Cirrosporium novae-zelandiae]
MSVLLSPSKRKRSNLSGEHQTVVTKRVKTDGDSIARCFRDDYSSVPFTLLVGPEPRREGERRFYVHENILRRRSSFFCAACDGPFQQGQEKTIHLPDAKPTTIAHLIYWLYNSRLPYAQFAKDFLPWSTLVELWVAAHRYDIKELRRDVLLALIDKRTDASNHDDENDDEEPLERPPTEVLVWGFNQAPADSLFRDIMVFLCLVYMREGKVSQLEELDDTNLMNERFVRQFSKHLIYWQGLEFGGDRVLSLYRADADALRDYPTVGPNKKDDDSD